jgi:methionine-rich copper-binding protein CopC
MRAVIAALTAVFAAAVLVLGVAEPASAHDELLSSDPAAGAVLDAAPEAITLTFSGVLTEGEGATEMAVTDAAGNDLTTGSPVLDGVRVTQPIDGAAASGTIRVAWRVVSSDGHPISGEYSFAVGEGSSVEPSATAPAEASSGPGELLVVWIAVGVIVVAAAVFLVVLTRRRPSRED